MVGLEIVKRSSHNLLAVKMNASFWTTSSVITLLLMIFSEDFVPILDLSRISAGSFCTLVLVCDKCEWSELWLSVFKTPVAG